MGLKEKRPLVFGIDFKVLKRLVFGYNAKMIVETNSELEKMPPDLSKLDMFGKFARIESKGVTEACVTEACLHHRSKVINRNKSFKKFYKLLLMKLIPTPNSCFFINIV